MKKNVFICMLFFIFMLGFSKDQIKADLKLKNKKVLIFSEFGYKVKYGGFYIGEKPAPWFYGFYLTCKKKKAYRVYRNIYLDGKIDEKKEEIPLKDYLNFWNDIEQNKVWDLKTIDIQNPFWIKNGEYLKDLDPYDANSPSPILESDYFEFCVRVENQSNSYNVRGIDALKDKRYKTILNRINDFFLDLIKQ